MTVEAIIQARMGSSRLRGKSLMPLAGIPILKRVIDSVRKNTFINNLTLATTNFIEDDPIFAYSNFLSINCVRGDSSNVLSRYIKASEHLKKEDVIIRVTADNPFNRIDVSEFLFQEHILGGYDYTYVEGLSHVAYEIIKVGALRKLYDQETLSDYDKEHVTPFFRENKEKFNLLCLDSTVKGLNPAIDKLLTIDNGEDHKRIEKMIIDLKYDSHLFIDFKSIYEWLQTNNN